MPAIAPDVVIHNTMHAKSVAVQRQHHKASDCAALCCTSRAMSEECYGEVGLGTTSQNNASQSSVRRVYRAVLDPHVSWRLK